MLIMNLQSHYAAFSKDLLSLRLAMCQRAFHAIKPLRLWIFWSNTVVSIPTGGEDFFLLFRLYGPETKDFYKFWELGDVVKVK
jgi:hypothetical protein